MGSSCNTRDTRHICRQAILLLLFVGLLLCFLFQVQEQVVKYYEGKTTQTVEKVAYNELPLPYISLCMESPFKKQVLLDMGLPERFFLTAEPSIATGSFPSLNETWQKATYSAQELEVTWRLWPGQNASISVKPFNTIYNGQCYVWSTPALVSTTTPVVKDIYVNLSTDEDSCIASIHPSMPPLIAALNRWYVPMTTLSIRNGRFFEVKLSKIHTNTLNSATETGCNDTPKYSYAECLRTEVTREYLSFPKRNCPNVTEPCWIPHVDDIISPKYLDAFGPCTSWESYHCMFNSLKEANNVKAQNCEKPCTLPSVQINSKNLHMPPLIRNGQVKRTLLRMFYSTTTVLNFNDYRLVDFGTIVAAVGGSLGLFLGFSCYQCWRKIFNSLFDLCE